MRVRREQIPGGVRRQLLALLTHRRAIRVTRNDVYRDGVSHGSN